MFWKFVAVMLAFAAVFFAVPALIDNDLMFGVDAVVCAWLASVTWTK